MQWEWEDNNGAWTAFPDVDSLSLDAAFLADLPFWLARSSGMVVEFDRLHGIHVETATGESFAVHRMSSIEWCRRCCEGDWAEWRLYPSEISREIEAAFVARKSDVIVRFGVDGVGDQREYKILLGPGDGLTRRRGEILRVRRTEELVDEDESSKQGLLWPGMQVTLSNACRPIEMLSENCPICLDQAISEEARVIELVHCNHAFHEKCIRSAFVNKAECPVCEIPYEVIRGTMPTNGTMTVYLLPPNDLLLGGYENENVGTISIRYHFPDGIQGPEHPSPGSPYTGAARTAYLPNDEEGLYVLGLLQVAWDMRLTFKVGPSLANGQEFAMKWGDILHKTSPNGGTKNGWPDDWYLSRVRGELETFGIV
jgi:deltex